MNERKRLLSVRLKQVGSMVRAWLSGPGTAMDEVALTCVPDRKRQP